LTKNAEDVKDMKDRGEKKAVPVSGLTLGYKEMRRNVPRVHLCHPDLLKDSEYVKEMQARGEHTNY
jgi:hypothetical protein